MKRCVINFARGGWYVNGQERLRSSLIQTHFTGHTLFIRDEASIGAPTHENCPYGFKPFLLQAAFENGYESVLWCDASVWAIRNIEPMFAHIEQEGHMFFVNTCTGEWTSDACLQVFGLSREDAMNITMLMGICMGFNLKSPLTQQFLEEWLAHAKDGVSFPGSWTNERRQVSKDPRVKGHRHDQSVASILAWKFGMNLVVAHETFFQYYENPQHTICNGDYSLIKPNVLMVAQGL